MEDRMIETVPEAALAAIAGGAGSTIDPDGGRGTMDPDGRGGRP